MISQRLIVRQQQVLKYLGYYNGKVDGVWSTKSGQAKIAFERSGKFNPGIPNNGMPFEMGKKLPEGLYFDKGLVAIQGIAVQDLPELQPELPVIEERVVSTEEDDDEDISSIPTQVYDPAVGGQRQLSRKERKKLLREQKGMSITETAHHPDGSKSTVSSNLAFSHIIDPEKLIAE